MVIWDFLTGPRLGDPEGILVGNFRTSPGWGSKKDFGLKNIKVRRSGERMEMWSDGPKEDVTGPNGRVRAW